jgi:hypothetical protein
MLYLVIPVVLTDFKCLNVEFIHSACVQRFQLINIFFCSEIGTVLTNIFAEIRNVLWTEF